MKRLAPLGILLVFLSIGFLYFLKGRKEEDPTKNYRLTLSLEGEKLSLKVYTREGTLMVGKNVILVKVEPAGKLENLYFYMPPMPGMGEMREDVKLKEIKSGLYEGIADLSMAGSWQLVAQLEGKKLTKDLSIPSGGEEKEKGQREMGIKVDPQAMQLIGIQSEEVKREELIESFSAVGYVSYDASWIYEINLRSDGWVLETFGRFEGELIQKGTPLMKVLSPEVEIAQEELRLAKEMGRERLEELARQKLSYLKEGEVIRSPYGGVILEKRVFPGGYIKAGDIAYKIADVSKVWIIAQVPQVYTQSVKKGIRVMVLPVGSQDPIFGRVAYIFPEADKETRTLRVRIDVPLEKGLKINQMVEVYFEKPLGSLLVVPESAVVDTGKRQLVFVEIKPGVYEPRKVKLGRRIEGKYEVLEGLKEGERVVVKGAFLLDSEAQIKGFYGEEVKTHEHSH